MKDYELKYYTAILIMADLDTTGNTRAYLVKAIDEKINNLISMMDKNKIEEYKLRVQRVIGE